MSIQTLIVPKGAVLSINSELSIPIGTQIDILNQSILYNCYLKYSVTEPPASTVDMRMLTQIDLPRPCVLVETGTEEVWVYSPQGSVELSVQVI